MDITESAGAAAEADARVLEAAAAVLLRRYGQAGGGKTARVLNETATSIREPAGTQPAEAATEPEPPAEGWGVIRPGDRRAHYYVNGMSLCRRVGFYQGPLEDDSKPSFDDHKECRKLLVRRQAAAVIVTRGGPGDDEEPGHGYWESGDYS